MANSTTAFRFELVKGIRPGGHVWRGGLGRERMPAWHHADLISFATT